MVGKSFEAALESTLGPPPRTFVSMDISLYKKCEGNSNRRSLHNYFYLFNKTALVP